MDRVDYLLRVAELTKSLYDETRARGVRLSNWKVTKVAESLPCFKAGCSALRPNS